MQEMGMVEGDVAHKTEKFLPNLSLPSIAITSISLLVRLFLRRGGKSPSETLVSEPVSSHYYPNVLQVNRKKKKSLKM